WPGEPLDLILARSAQLKQQEWQAVVGQYRGKGFIFDAEIRRAGTARQYQAKVNRARRAPALRLELQDLTLLTFLPLDEPKHLLFGARLADVRREGDDCVVRLEPDSGVLLTDVTAAALGNLMADGPLQTILKQQREWTAQIP